MKKLFSHWKKQQEKSEDMFSTFENSIRPAALFGIKDEAELIAARADRLARTIEQRKEKFAKLPIEIREEILKLKKQKEVFRAIEDIAYSHVMVSQKEHDLYDLYMRTQHYSDPYGRSPRSPIVDEIEDSHEDPIDYLPPYEDMMTIHVDKAAREIILKDKD